MYFYKYFKSSLYNTPRGLCILHLNIFPVRWQCQALLFTSVLSHSKAAPAGNSCVRQPWQCCSPARSFHQSLLIWGRSIIFQGGCYSIGMPGTISTICLICIDLHCMAQTNCFQEELFLFHLEERKNLICNIYISTQFWTHLRKKWFYLQICQAFHVK